MEHVAGAGGSPGGVAATLPARELYSADHAHVRAVVNALEGTMDYWQCRRALKEEAVKPSYRVESFAEYLPSLMEELGLATRMRNYAFAMRERLPGLERGGDARVRGDESASGDGGEIDSDARAEASGTPSLFDDDARETAGMLESIAVARRVWRRQLTERLNELSAASGTPLASAARDDAGDDGGATKSKRSAAAADDPIALASIETASIVRAIDRMAFTETARADLPHLYGHADLLRAASNVGWTPEDGGASTPAHVPSWGLVKIELRAPSTTWLRAFFRQTAPEHAQIGVDDLVDASYAARRDAVAAALAKERSIPKCRAFAKTGVPASRRGAIWSAALGAAAPGDQRARAHFDALCDDVRRRSLLVDALFARDVAETCDHATYFPFAESLRAVALAFSRDARVPDLCVGSGRCAPHPMLDGVARDGTKRRDGGRGGSTYPPCGVLPFDGFASFLAPLAFIYAHPAELLDVFERMYARYFCRLHVLSDETFPSPALVGLLRAFEDLAQRHEPALCFHLLSINAPAATLASAWIVHAFARHLDATQTLLLWDRIVGYDSVLPIAVAAAAVIAFRKDALMRAASAEEAREAVEDLSSLQIVPLLQAFLWRDGDGADERR